MWEYKIMDDESGLGTENGLDKLGAEGWELICIQPTCAGGYLWYFKRKLEVEG